MKNKKAEIIIGFQPKLQFGKTGTPFKESDIGLSAESSMYDALQIIHAC